MGLDVIRAWIPKALRWSVFDRAVGRHPLAVTTIPLVLLFCHALHRAEHRFFQ
jgi:hypothetical protein